MRTTLQWTRFTAIKSQNLVPWNSVGELAGHYLGSGEQRVQLMRKSHFEKVFLSEENQRQYNRLLQLRGYSQSDLKLILREPTYQATLSQNLNTISSGSGTTLSGNTSWTAFFISASKIDRGSSDIFPHFAAHPNQAYDNWIMASPWGPRPLNKQQQWWRQCQLPQKK